MRLAQRIGFLALLLVAATPAIAAGTWPTRPIKLIVPVAAGGGVDEMARIMAASLSEQLGESVIVEDMGGAGGALGANAVAKAKPDGYTFLFAGPGQASLPAMHKHLPYDTASDFAGVSLVAQFPLVMVVNPKLPVKSLREFIALLKTNPGKYTFGSSGVGGSSHIPVELFKRLAGVDMLHVPYHGNAESSAALIAGQIDMIIDGLAPQLGNIKVERVRPLGVTTRTARRSWPMSLRSLKYCRDMNIPCGLPYLRRRRRRVQSSISSLGKSRLPCKRQRQRSATTTSMWIR
jgi:tripartite-type tricarboxylate transporter receptor subunit TctC